MATYSEIRRFLDVIQRKDYKVTEKMWGYLVERPDGNNVFVNRLEENYENLIYNLMARRQDEDFF